MSGDVRAKDNKSSLSHRAQQKFKCVLPCIFDTCVVFDVMVILILDTVVMVQYCCTIAQVNTKKR